MPLTEQVVNAFFHILTLHTIASVDGWGLTSTRPSMNFSDVAA